MNENHQNTGLKNVEALLDYKFFVPSYQRGYRWKTQQVQELLDDIKEFEKEKDEQGFYCLQPVVVKQKSFSPEEIDSYKINIEIEKPCFELIDGQQRLSTIFLILKYLGRKPYQLVYETRPNSTVFLDKVGNLEGEDWDSYVNKNEVHNNIDNFHFYEAYQTIANWFAKNNENGFADKFTKILLKQVKVIWYETPEKGTAENVFIKFNQGRIPLEQAELIKALFVLDFKRQNSDLELQELKLNQFAEEWNSIELMLQNDSLWYFVNNNTNRSQANRIDLLFDLIKEKSNNNDSLFSYRKYLADYKSRETEQGKKSDTKKMDWQEVKKLAYTIQEWFEDREVFHAVGFLVSEKLWEIQDILKKYNELDSKQDFIKELKKKIREELKKKEIKILNKESSKIYFFNNKEEEDNSIGYRDATSKKNALTVLKLFNIITYQNTDFTYRFPFDKLKKTSWNLEHIHPQNPQKISTVVELIDWLTDARQTDNEDRQSITKGVKENYSTLINELEELKENKLESEKVKEVLKSYNKQIEDATNISKDDSIGNLCLLDESTNKSVGNKPFRIKREKVLQTENVTDEEDKNFVPLATKNAFLKYYTQNSTKIQMSYWGLQDRQDYESAIANTIGLYLNN